MTAWVRYSLLVGTLVLGVLLVRLVQRPGPVVQPLDAIGVDAFDAEPPVDSPPLLRTIELDFSIDEATRGPVRPYLEMMDLPSTQARETVGRGDDDRRARA